MSLPRNQILVGDALTKLRTLPTGSIDMALTSPPYFRLRQYDMAGQIGLEQTVDDWVDQLRPVMTEIGRVLTPTGSLWLNLGDSYSTHPREGAPRKSLLLGPERLALRLLADGWVLRNKIIWRKANPMPTSVADRLACTYEYIYVFVRQSRYFFDLNGIRRPLKTVQPARSHLRHEHGVPREFWRGPNAAGRSGLAKLKATGLTGHPLGANPGDVWRISSSNYRGAHHATFPVELARRAIQAGSPEARCSRCRTPWRRLVERTARTVSLGPLAATCLCGAAPESAVVIDPFFGAGTTGLAAEQLGRNWIGIELNPAYAALARSRLDQARAGPVPA